MRTAAPVGRSSPPTFVAPSPARAGCRRARRPAAFGQVECTRLCHPVASRRLEAHYDRLRSQYGDRAVMVVLSRLADQFRPGPRRDQARRRRRDRQTTQGAGARVAPVDVHWVRRSPDDVHRTGRRRQGPRRTHRLRQGFLERQPHRCRRFRCIHRIGAAASGRAVGRRRQPSPREKEPEIPADADALTKSLIQLKSPDVFRKKDALERLTRIRPTNRQKEVLEAILPLLDHDDEDLVKHAVRVLAVWQSPEALAKLIDLVNDSRVFLRWEIIKSLGKYDEPKGRRGPDRAIEGRRSSSRGGLEEHGLGR